MTLNTKIFIEEAMDPEEVFGIFLEHIKGDVAEPKIDRSEPGRIMSACGQGLDAWLWVTWNPDGATMGGEDEYPDDEVFAPRPTHRVHVSMDTGYGYNRDGQTCGQLHAKAIALAAPRLTGRWWWQNEYTGDIYRGTNGLDTLAGDSERASRWFRDVLVPIVESGALTMTEGAP